MIIGLIGYKQSGKTTVAEYLHKEHEFHSLNFKDGLITEMKDKLHDTLAQIALDSGYSSAGDDQLAGANIDRLFKTKPPVMRALMQNYGTDVRRDDSHTYWVDRYLQALEATEDDLGFQSNIVTDDVRFINEAEIVKAQGGILIRIIREDLPVRDLHISETENEKIEEDFTIEAKTGEYEYIYRQVESILNDLKKNVD